MKVKTQESSEVNFKPFELVITLESLEEAGAIFALFNHASIIDIVQEAGVDHYGIRKEMNKKVKNIPYEKVHDALNKEIKWT